MVERSRPGSDVHRNIVNSIASGPVKVFEPNFTDRPYFLYLSHEVVRFSGSWVQRSKLQKIFSKNMIQNGESIWFAVDFYLVHGLIAKRLDEDDRNTLNYFECPEVQLGLHAI